MANPKTKNILISMMIAMSSAFLIGSILLLSRDTYAANGNENKSYQYTGYADTREVVSEAVFVESGNLYKEVGKMTVSGENTMNVSKDIVSNHKILSGNLDIKTILSGNEVTVGTDFSNIKNIFVFSNTSNFKPEIHNAFYINATDGLGISGPSVKSGVNVHGIVKVGLTETCDTNNLGAIGMAQKGCLVGCAKLNGNGDPKWHLIDKSETCQTWCQSDGNCETTSPADTTRKLRKGICTGEVAANPSYTPCSKAEDRAKSLTGVSFISYFTPACPETDEPGMVNPCAYTCSDMNDTRCKSGSPNGGGDNPTTPDIPHNICSNRKFKCKDADLINTGHNGDQNEYYWTCKKGSITQECGLCDENSINAGEVPPTLHNGYCAKSDPDNEQCCQKIPQNAHPLFFDRESDNGIGHLCTNIAFTPNPNSNEDNSTCTRTDADNNLHSFEDLHGNDICPCYGNHSGGRVKSCITTQNSNGLDVKECVDLGEFFCDNNGSITYEQAMETEKFECDPGYVLDGCNCVKNDDHSNPDYGYLSCGWEPNTCKEGYIGLGVSKNGSNLNWMCSNGLGTEYRCSLSCEEPQYWQEHSNIWFCSNPSTETLSCCPEGFEKQQDGTCKISSANMFKVKTETGYIVKETVYLYRHNGAFEDQNGKKYQIEWQYDGNDSNTEMFYGSEYIDSDAKKSIMYYIKKVSDYYNKGCVTFNPIGVYSDFSEIKLCNNNNFSVPSNINYCQCDSIENKCYGGDGSYDGSHYTKGYDGSHYTKGYYGSTWICGNVNNRCYRCDNTKGFYKDTNGKCQHVCGTDTLNWKPGKELNSDSNLCSSVGVYVNETLSGSKGTGYSWECKGGSRRKNVYECRTY